MRSATDFTASFAQDSRDARVGRRGMEVLGRAFEASVSVGREGLRWGLGLGMSPRHVQRRLGKGSVPMDRVR